ncbi:MAG: amidohydrolase family protein [Caulobacteraceae bacterium]
MSRILLAALAAAASIALVAPAGAETVAITNAHIYSMGPAGEIASGTVVITNGKIASVGASATIPAGARVIDAHGQVVTPGLVATNTPLSTVEVSEGVSETDDNATASAKLSAAFDLQYAINPDSILIPTARLGGITDAIVTPTLGRDRNRRDMLFAGQAAAIQLGAGTEMLRRPRIGMVLIMGEEGAKLAGGSRAAEMVLIRAMLEDVRSYAKNKAAYDQGRTRAYALSHEDLEALIPVVDGREPLMVSVHRAADIRQVLQLGREEKLKLILEGAEEGWMVAPEIAAAHVPVLLSGFEDLPSSFDRIAATLENSARLNAAGVTVAIENPPIYQGGRTPRIDAGRAVAHGLPFDAALASITINPARIWGVDDKVGSLTPGKDADVVVWSGDPLEPLSAPTAVIIKGVEQPLRDRDLDLRDRYLKAGNGYPSQYDQP